MKIDCIFFLEKSEFKFLKILGLRSLRLPDPLTNSNATACYFSEGWGFAQLKSKPNLVFIQTLILLQMGLCSVYEPKTLLRE
jgi:hypothetical protein